MNTTTVVEVKNVFKNFDGKQALNNVSFTVNRGEIFVLVGPNGAGKTTTVKILSGVLEPDNGEVYVFNTKMSTYNLDAKRKIGYLPDEPYIYGKLTGKEFIEFIMSVYGSQPSLTEYEFFLSKFEMEQVINQPIETYSKGMKQKLLLMSIFLRNPELYILDEPLSGLDPRCISFFKQHLKDQTALGKTVLLCTHILELAEQLATRVCIINNGQILLTGTRQELAKKLSLNTDRLEDIYLKTMLQYTT